MGKVSWLLVEDVIFAFDSFVFCDFVAFDGKNFQLLFFFKGIAIVFDERFKILNIFQTLKSIHDLLIDHMSSRLQQFNKRPPSELWHFCLNILFEKECTF